MAKTGLSLYMNAPPVAHNDWKIDKAYLLVSHALRY